jgi:serine phosphatase RsbU (regulator of sigma subunit)/anti-sigma regulatory factor (Ser/Thr protein kinase)
MGIPGYGAGPAKARERYFHGDPITDEVRSTILGSWQRCKLLGLSPDKCNLPYQSDFDLDGRLISAAEPVLDRLQSKFAGSRMNISLADAGGTVLQRRFGEVALARRLPEFQSVPGFVFAERYGGTNGIGTTLAERRLCWVYGAEHFAERSQTSACVAIPLHDLLSGSIEGILCFGFPRTDTDPALETIIREAAAAIERRLLEQASAREQALLRAYLDARRRVGIHKATGNGHRVTVDRLAESGLDWHDQMVLKEKAAELIGGAQRAATELVLPGGRQVTLLSRPVTGSSGVQGIIVEVVLPHTPVPRHIALPHHEQSPEHPLRRPTTVGTPPLGRPADTVPAQAAGTVICTPPAPHPRIAVGGTTGRTAGGTAENVVGELLLVGEPQVGKYAIAARRRLELLSEASTRIGTTLDVGRTAQELAEMAVPCLADFVTIDLPDAVLRGEASADPRTDLRRTVVHGIKGTDGTDGTGEDGPFSQVGDRVHLHPTTPQLRCLDSGEAILVPDLRIAAGWLAQNPQHAERLLAHNVHSLITVPLRARGVVLGIASFYRAHDPSPFGDDDRSLAQELATRAAICIDNARRYTREHGMVLALQRSLLPRKVPEQSAVEVAHRYLPAETSVGGDWFDVIPLSGARVALVVGDVVGHGLHAAATMGRLRTAAHHFAELDLAPDEFLAHLDNHVVRLDREESSEEDGPGSTGVFGATCLYAIYDPTTQQCVMARAGHPPPALVGPDGTVTFLDFPSGPPLGLGSLPFEAAQFHVPEGSQLVLYSDGLIEDRGRDIDTAFDQLSRVLAHPGRPPEDTCQAIMDTVAPAHPGDDIALLVARTMALNPQRIATWSLTADPAQVRDLRACVTRQLTDWGLDETTFAAELILSELVTNAIRYGAEPIRVRLLHDRTLICEVFDASSTTPHLRRAAHTDEGGRGLFLVAQLAQAWGTRYTGDGKVIWAECPLGRTGAGAFPQAIGLQMTDLDDLDDAGIPAVTGSQSD